MEFKKLQVTGDHFNAALVKPQEVLEDKGSRANFSNSHPHLACSSLGSAEHREMGMSVRSQ